jgi:hypothetical protein
MPTIVSEPESQGYLDHIEAWFQMIVSTQHSSIIQHLLAPDQPEKPYPHILVFIKAYLLNLNMSRLTILLRTWLHWKSSYTLKDASSFK